jgi:uncharacterized protein (TIGR00251 family)
VYVFEGLLLAELAVLFVMGIWWALSRKPKKGQEGEKAYHVAREFWRVVLDRRRVFAGEGLKAEELLAGPNVIGEKFELEDIPTVTVTVAVTGESSCDQIVKFENDEIKMLVSGPAGSGAANKAVLTMLTEVLGVQPFQVNIVRGHFAERKAVAIQGIDRVGLEKKLASFL